MSCHLSILSVQPSALSPPCFEEGRISFHTVPRHQLSKRYFSPARRQATIMNKISKWSMNRLLSRRRRHQQRMTPPREGTSWRTWRSSSWWRPLPSPPLLSRSLTSTSPRPVHKSISDACVETVDEHQQKNRNTNRNMKLVNQERR